MPHTFSNDIDLVRKDPRPKKTPKKPPPEPWPVPAFEPLQIQGHNDPGEPNIPTGLDRHDPLALFRLFFTDTIMEKIAVWTNKHAESHPPSDEQAPLGRGRVWRPTNRRELYGYFRGVIYMGVVQ